MLMAAGLEPPRCVAAHGWLLVKGEKMSKTKLNQIAPADLVDDLGVDAVRYHFLREVPFGPDGDFSYEGMVARYNADLANNLGNLLSRVATLVGSKCGGIGPAAPADSPLAAVAGVVYDSAAAAWDRLSPSDALEASWQLIREANAHLEDNEPWKSEPGPEVDAVLGAGIEALRIVAILASPAMPAATGEVWRRLGLPGSPEDQRLPEAAAWGGYPGGLPVEKGKPLFPRALAEQRQGLGRPSDLEGRAAAVHGEGEGEEAAARLLGGHEGGQVAERGAGVELQADAAVDGRAGGDVGGDVPPLLEPAGQVAGGEGAGDGLAHAAARRVAGPVGGVGAEAGDDAFEVGGEGDELRSAGAGLGELVRRQLPEASLHGRAAPAVPLRA